MRTALSRPQRGFTLIEMLVALFVFAMGALALLRLEGYSVATASDISAQQMANLVVQNEAALVRSDRGPLLRGTAKSAIVNGGRHFSIERTVRATDDRRLVRIDLVAVETGSSRRAMLTLVKRVE